MLDCVQFQMSSTSIRNKITSRIHHIPGHCPRTIQPSMIAFSVSTRPALPWPWVSLSFHYFVVWQQQLPSHKQFGTVSRPSAVFPSAASPFASVPGKPASISFTSRAFRLATCFTGAAIVAPFACFNDSLVQCSLPRVVQQN